MSDPILYAVFQYCTHVGLRALMTSSIYEQRLPAEKPRPEFGRLRSSPIYGLDVIGNSE